MAEDTFIQHYINFLASPAGFLALILVAPIVLHLSKEVQKRREASSTARIPGCRRMARQSKSNLQDQYDSLSTEDSEPRVKAIYVYPVKSCRGVELSASEVTSTGLRFDRLFSFAQLVSSTKQTAANEDGIAETDAEITHQWRFITQREVPRLALLSTELWIPNPRQLSEKQDLIPSNGDPAKAPSKEHRTTGNGSLKANQVSPAQQVEDWAGNGGCLVIRFPYEQAGSIFGTKTDTITIKVPLQPTLQRAKAKGYTYESMSIWTDYHQSINISSEIDNESLAKLKYFLGISNPLGLFRVDDKNLRGVSRGLPKDRPDEKFHVGFADAFPLHLLNIASVRDVDKAMPTGSRSKGKLDAIRFRANIYVSGPEAFAEDGWMRISVGRPLAPEGQFGIAEYHAACRTARCTLPNTHPESGVKDRNEPFTTLKRTRQVDEGAKPHPCLGLSMIPLFKQGIIRCGDRIEVLETGEHFYEKMFP